MALKIVTRSKNWVWTVVKIKTLPKWDDSVSYAIWHIERCPVTGKKHLQGFTQFKKMVGIKQVKKLIGKNALCEIAKNASMSEKYARSVYTRVAGPWTYGTKPTFTKSYKKNNNSDNNSSTKWEVEFNDTKLLQYYWFKYMCLKATVNIKTQVLLNLIKRLIMDELPLVNFMIRYNHLYKFYKREIQVFIKEYLKYKAKEQASHYSKPKNICVMIGPSKIWNEIFYKEAFTQSCSNGFSNNEKKEFYKSDKMFLTSKFPCEYLYIISDLDKEADRQVEITQAKEKNLELKIKNLESIHSLKPPRLINAEKQKKRLFMNFTRENSMVSLEALVLDAGVTKGQENKILFRLANRWQISKALKKSKALACFLLQIRVIKEALGLPENYIVTREDSASRELHRLIEEHFFNLSFE